MKRARGRVHRAIFWTRLSRVSKPSSLMYANTHTEISVREIHPAEVVRLPPHPFRTQTSSGELRVGPAFVFEIPNVNFWGYYGGAVVTADNAVLADLSPEVWGPANHQFIRAGICQSRGLLSGRIAIGVTPEASGNYYHWLLDLVPRVLLLKHAAQNFSNYDALLLNGSRANYEREILAALGVPPEKIRYVDSRERFQIASAVFPSMDINVIAPWKVHDLRDLPFSGKQNQHRRLYLSRARAAVRRIANENEISEVLRHRNFEIVESRKSFLAGTGKLVRRRECDCRATWRGAGQHRVLQAGNARGGDQYPAPAIVIGIGSSPQLPGSPTK